MYIYIYIYIYTCTQVAGRAGRRMIVLRESNDQWHDARERMNREEGTDNDKSRENEQSSRRARNPPMADAGADGDAAAVPRPPALFRSVNRGQRDHKGSFRGHQQKGAGAVFS